MSVVGMLVLAAAMVVAVACGLAGLVNYLDGLDETDRGF